MMQTKEGILGDVKLGLSISKETLQGKEVAKIKISVVYTDVLLQNTKKKSSPPNSESAAYEKYENSFQVWLEDSGEPFLNLSFDFLPTTSLYYSTVVHTDFQTLKKLKIGSPVSKAILRFNPAPLKSGLTQVLR